MELYELLKMMVAKKASDMHLRVPSSPVFRIDGVLAPQNDLPPVGEKDVELAFERIANPTQRSVFLQEKELDFAYSVSGVARFRVSVMRQRGTMSIAFRRVPFDVSSIDDLELPQILKQMVLKRRGLILVTGPAGSGKSTTVAAMLNHLNHTERRNVITIEDTIEYLFSNDKCLIAQRDIGDDTQSFATALRHALRQDADVIFVGEMLDPDTMSYSIRAAETGSLVIGTFDANDSINTIDLIAELFPKEKQQQIRIELSRVLDAIFSQRLVTRVGGGRIAVFETLIVDDQIRQLIYSGQMTRASDNGHILSFKDSLAELVAKGIISREAAVDCCGN